MPQSVGWQFIGHIVLTTLLEPTKRRIYQLVKLPQPDQPTERKFKVESSLLVNEGGVQCVPLVFAHPVGAQGPLELGSRPLLGGAPVTSVDPVRAAQRGPGLVAFVLEDPMDGLRFHPGDLVTLSDVRPL